jgi:hypothetical protein
MIIKISCNRNIIRFENRDGNTSTRSIERLHKTTDAKW